MNEQQIHLMIWVQVQEQELSKTFYEATYATRKMQKELLHFYAMQEFDRLEEQKPLNLSEEECDQECIFCHPGLILSADKILE